MTAVLPDWFQGGRIETVVVVFPDALGRLMGKRLTHDHFRDQVLADGSHACNYLLTVDVELTPLPGFALANWDKGYGDFHLAIDLATLRPVPWMPGTALVLADLSHMDGTPVAEAPRAILRRQIARLAERGLTACTASELEFHLFHESYRECAGKNWRRMVPSSDYLIDYDVMQTSRDEPYLARVRKSMIDAGIPIEGTKGEWGKGQHEINIMFSEALEAADRHVVLKHGMKEMAAQDGRAVTFMAKLGTDESGSSCHIHLSLWDQALAENRFSERGGPEAHGVIPLDPVSSSGGDRSGGTRLFRQFLGGLLAYGRELSCFFAPTVNAYKRYQPGSWAPTALVWAEDNRTTGFRVVGHGRSLRIENRMPGADANPYLAYAAMIAAGLAGVAEDLDCGEPYRKNAYTDDSLPKLPSSLDEAAELFDQSRLARHAFGDSVVDHYAHAARLEAAAARREVSDWERARYFERI